MNREFDFRVLLIKIQDLLSDGDRQRLHFLLGPDVVPKNLRDDTSISGALRVLESLMEKAIISDQECNYLIDAFKGVHCHDAAKRLQEYQQAQQRSNQRTFSLQNILLKDNDEEDKFSSTGVVCDTILNKYPSTSLTDVTPDSNKTISSPFLDKKPKEFIDRSRWKDRMFKRPLNTRECILLIINMALLALMLVIILWRLKSCKGLLSTNITNTTTAAPAIRIPYSVKPGETYSSVITGAIGGSIYGTNIYTDDSNLATAAVHAGVLHINETRTITVKILSGQASYNGSIQNGVTSSSYGAWRRSYSFVDIPHTSNVTPSNLAGYGDGVGQTFPFVITGGNDGYIYGTNIYADDSNLAKAAVHAGVLHINETRTITVKILSGQASYNGSTQNGVTSLSYGAWGRSYSFVDIPHTSNVAPSNFVGYGTNIFTTQADKISNKTR